MPELIEDSKLLHEVGLAARIELNMSKCMLYVKTVLVRICDSLDINDLMTIAALQHNYSRKLMFIQQMLCLDSCPNTGASILILVLKPNLF